MNREEFLEWLDELNVQTLTDELKEQIRANAEEAFEQEADEFYDKGYDTCRNMLVEFIKDDL